MKTAINNLLFFSAVGIPIIVVSLISPGPDAGRVLFTGIAVMIIGLMFSLYYWIKGKKADQSYGDERENFIVGRSMRFTFWVMAVAVQTCWWYNFSFGNYGSNGVDYPVILLGAFWGSFLVAYIYNKVRV